MGIGSIFKAIASLFGKSSKRKFNGNLMDPSNWTIGPIIKDKNYSVGMPLRPSPNPDGSWYIDLPEGVYPPASHVHYVTCDYGPLTGKTRIRIKGNIALDPGARIVPRTSHEGPGLMSLYFQREGDDWTGGGKYETYRWYASFATLEWLKDGDFVIDVSLAPSIENLWSAVFSNTCMTPNGANAYLQALEKTEKVGFVLGGGDGLGHGLYVEGGKGRITVTEFTIE